MNNRAKRGFRLFCFLAATIVAISALIVIAKLSRSKTPRITVMTDSNGVPQFAGVPLSNTNLRDATFTAMHAMGLKAGLAVPFRTLTNGDPRVTNVIDTLESMTRAGLFERSTNSSSSPGTNYKPSPFE
jgi:hypothetical protein